MRYKDLIIWQKSHALTLKSFNALKNVTRSLTSDIVVRQLVRAVTSIGANIAEGYSRHEGKEYLRYLEIAYGSSNEVDNWLTVLKDTGSIKSEIAQELINDNEEILKILVTMIKKFKIRSL